MLIQEQFNKLILQQIQRAGNTTMFFTIEEAKETMLDISQGIECNFA